MATSKRNKSGANRVHAQRMFEQADFIRHLGMKLVKVGRGRCETVLRPKREHRQQHGFVHAAVVTAMADHTGGCAAGTTVGPGLDVITVEFKISFLRPAAGRELRCRGEVLRAGKSLIFAEAEVFARDGREEKMVAKAMMTLTIIPDTLGGK